MTPIELLKLVQPKLESFEGCYCLAGGLAASLYRNQPRLTNDVDIALSIESYEKSKKVAVKILKELGFKASMGWIANATDRMSEGIALVIGQHRESEYESTIDFLLPSLPWLDKAVERAQSHLVDFGFGMIPTMTREDVIIAKLYALAIEPNRFQDLDDLKSIFISRKKLDTSYLKGELHRHSLQIPKLLVKLAPKLGRMRGVAPGKNTSQ